MTYTIADTNPVVRGAYHFCNAIERGSHKFPLNLFFGLQSFTVCQWYQILSEVLFNIL
jgi:hypothetical protein